MALICGIDHVNLSIPAGSEELADRFYLDVLDLALVPKPAGVGGRWYQAGGFQIHLGAVGDFSPATAAHPALLVDGLGELTGRLTSAGIAFAPEGEPMRRLFVHDPFGNRIECIEAHPQA